MVKSKERRGALREYGGLVKLRIGMVSVGLGFWDGLFMMKVVSSPVLPVLTFMKM